MQTTLRVTGWALMGAGALILLYLVWLLGFTNVTTEQAQQEMLEEWELEVGAPQAAVLPGEPVGDESSPAKPAAEPVEAGDAYAVMWFERPGADERPVHADPLSIVAGVDPVDLRRGPGHYPQTDEPGGPGNFAISGHRTTYGAPFYHLDDLEAGDQIHVVDRSGQRSVYAVSEQRIVGPNDVWVLGDDPLGASAGTMTLTTCHPRFSNSQRLIVFAELLSS